mgnify:CR=1 FL=1
MTYLVKITDNTSWKTVKITDGDMDVTEDYTNN